MSDGRTVPQPVLDLATAWGVEPAYRAIDGRVVEAGVEELVAVLRALGAPIETAADAADAVAAERGRRPTLPACVVAWEDESAPAVAARLQGDEGTVAASVELEDGGFVEVAHRVADLAHAPEGGERGPGSHGAASRRRLPLPTGLPPGRHRLRLAGSAVPGGEASCALLAAPRRAQPLAPRSWGAFLPVHALHSESSWGVGDLGDLGELARWLGARGATTLGVLPLLATWDDDPSPYSPVSRVAWSEVFVDLARTPEVRDDEACRALVASEAVQREIDAVRATDRVPHARVVALKHRVLGAVADALDRAPGSQRSGDFRRFVEESPHADGHATFRAVMARRGSDPKSWSETTLEELRRADRDERVRRVHLVGQWLAERQLAAVARDEAAAAVALDLPIGVNDWGYDAWRDRDAFVDSVSIGAPPDPFFDRGQDWGFRPLNPRTASARGHAHLAGCLRHQLRWARVLRVDHVLGLRRLYLVPHGMDARRGVYVRQPQEELFALLTLLSRRHHCTVVGENLGTVPPEIDRALDEHGIPGMHVLQFSLGGGAVEPPSGDVVASLDTHDTPTFAAFWRDAGAEARRAVSRALVERGLVERDAEGESDGGGEADEADELGADAARDACLRLLARSDARHVQVALEDLWLEEDPQNVPGTSGPENWTRRARLSLEEIRSDDRVRAALERIACERDDTGETR